MTKIAIVAHPSRRTKANELAAAVKADAVFWDREGLGCETNHARAWDWLAINPGPADEWRVALEDDAKPVPEFRFQLEKVLAAAPTDVVSLYLGTGYPAQWQDILRTAVRPDEDPHWLIAPDLLNCVAYGFQRKFADRVRREAQYAARYGVPIDAALTRLCRKWDFSVGYARPSIVNHDDGPPIVAERRDGQVRSRRRRAWKFGTRPVWESTSLVLSKPTLVNVDDEGRPWYETQERIYET